MKIITKLNWLKVKDKDSIYFFLKVKNIKEEIGPIWMDKIKIGNK